MKYHIKSVFCGMPLSLKLSGLLIILCLHAETVCAQREILPLPLDKLNRDSLNKVIQQKDKEKDYQALGEIYGGIYTYFFETNYTDSTLLYAIKAEENLLKAGDSSKYYFTQLYLGNMSIGGFDLNTAKSYYQKARDYYTRVKNYKLLAHSLGGFSGIYEALKDTPNMMKYNQLALEANKKGKDTMAEMGLQHNKILFLMGKNKLDEAIPLIKENISLINRAETIGNSEHQRIFWREHELLLLAECYYRKQNYLSAIQYLKEVKNFDELNEKITDASSIRKYRLLVNSYVQLNQKDSAIKYLEAFLSQSKKTLTEIKPEKLNELTIKYETEKKQRQLNT